MLVKHLERQKGDFDEWHLWENTRHKRDEEYIEELAETHDWIKCIRREVPKDDRGIFSGIRYFWDYPHDRDTIYVRLDDDVIWLEPTAIATLVRFKLENPEYSVVHANTVNSCALSHIHQKMGVLKLEEEIEYDHRCGIVNCCRWSKTIPLEIHKQFIQAIKDGTTEEWKFDKWVLEGYKRVSSNCICWKGGDLDHARDLMATNDDEEGNVVVRGPRHTGRLPVICGQALVVHGAFGQQRSPELEARIQEYSQFCPSTDAPQSNPTHS
jgi:hypothetical protein